MIEPVAAVVDREQYNAVTLHQRGGFAIQTMAEVPRGQQRCLKDDNTHVGIKTLRLVAQDLSCDQLWSLARSIRAKPIII